MNPGSFRLYRINGHEVNIGRPKPESFKRLHRRRLIEKIRKGEIHYIKPEQLWKRREIRLLGTAPDVVIARKLGRSYNSVQLKRQRLGIPVVPVQLLSAKAVLSLGRLPDAELAARFGKTVKAIRRWRARLGRQGFGSVKGGWTWRELQLLGKLGDAEVARQLNRTPRAVKWKRASLGIPVFRK